MDRPARDVNVIVLQVGGVIGKAGTIVKQVREETGARIRVVEGVPNCDERVIVISAPNMPGRPTHAAQVPGPALSCPSAALAGAQPCVSLGG